MANNGLIIAGSVVGVGAFGYLIYAVTKKTATASAKTAVTPTGKTLPATRKASTVNATTGSVSTADIIGDVVKNIFSGSGKKTAAKKTPAKPNSGKTGSGQTAKAGAVTPPSTGSYGFDEQTGAFQDSTGQWYTEDGFPMTYVGNNAYQISNGDGTYTEYEVDGSITTYLNSGEALCDGCYYDEASNGIFYPSGDGYNPTTGEIYDPLSQEWYNPSDYQTQASDNTQVAEVNYDNTDYTDYGDYGNFSGIKNSTGNVDTVFIVAALSVSAYSLYSAFIKK